MKENITLQELRKEVSSLVSYRNDLNGWAFYIQRYLRSGANVKDNSPLKLDTNELNAIKNYRKRGKGIEALLAKALLNNSFLLFIIEQIGEAVMGEIVWNLGAISSEYLERKYQIDIYKGSGYGKSFTEKFEIFRNTSYYDPEYLTLPYCIKSRFRSFFEPPASFHVITSKVTEESKYARYTSESEVFEAIPRIYYNLKLGLLKRGSSGRILKSGMTTLNKEVQFPEIFPKGLHKKMDDFSLLALVELLEGLDNGLSEIEVATLLKKIVEGFLKDDEVLYNHLMKIYTGNRSAVRVKDKYDPFYNALIAHTNEDEWIEPANFLTYLLFRTDQLLPINLSYGKLKLPIENCRWNDQLEVEMHNIFETVIAPYQNGVLYLLASLGLIETLSNFDYAYIDISVYGENHKINMPYDGLVFFRLTKLGKYILGIDPTYIAPESKYKPVEVLLSEDNLTISLSEKNDILTKTITTFGNKLGDRLFQITEQSFLKKIKAKWELDERVRELRILATNAPSHVWENFFTKLYQKFNPLEKVKGSFILFKIPTDNSRLVADLMSDSVLRALYTKVDGRQLLVKKKELPLFSKRMLDLGWVLGEYV